MRRNELGGGGGVGDRPRGAAALSPAQPSSAHLLVAGSQPLANRWALGRHSDEEANKGVVPEACWWESWGRWRRTCTVHESGLATGMRTSTWRRYEWCGPAQPTHGRGTPTHGPSSGPFFERPKPPFSPSSHPMSLKPHLPMNSLRISQAVPQVYALLLSLF